jgi:hypothetical protein
MNLPNAVWSGLPEYAVQPLASTPGNRPTHSDRPKPHSFTGLRETRQRWFLGASAIGGGMV